MHISLTQTIKFNFSVDLWWGTKTIKQENKQKDKTSYNSPGAADVGTD